MLFYVFYVMLSVVLQFVTFDVFMLGCLLCYFI